MHNRSYIWRPQAALLSILLLLCQFSISSAVSVRGFQFEVIASTGDQFSDISYFSMATNGDVVFSAIRSDGSLAIYSHESGENAVLVSQGDTIDGIKLHGIRSVFAFNSLHEVAFSTYRVGTNGTMSAYVLRDSSLEPITDDNPEFRLQTVRGINDDGEVVFDDSGVLYTGKNPDSLVTVFDRTGIGTASLGDINGSGQIAFSVFYSAAGREDDIATWTDGEFTIHDEAELSGPVVMTESGTVYYRHSRDELRQVRDGAVEVALSTANSPFFNFGSVYAANDSGSILFSGATDAAEGLYLIANGKSRLVAGLGEEIGGRVVSGVGAFRSLTNDGDFYFTLSFEDGAKTLYRSSISVPEPAAWASFTLSFAASSVRRRCLR